MLGLRGTAAVSDREQAPAASEHSREVVAPRSDALGLLLKLGERGPQGREMRTAREERGRLVRCHA